MNVLFVLGSAILGGAERQAIITAKLLRDHYGLRVQMILFRNPGGPVSQLCEAFHLPWIHIPFSDLGKTIYPYQILKYAYKFRKLKPDIIISYTDGPNVLCGLIWKWTGAKLFIWSQRSSQVFPRHDFLMEKALRNTLHVVSNSQIGIDHLKYRFPDATRHTRFYKIPNGILMSSPQYDRIQWRKRLGVRNDALLVLMIANLSTEYKDHPTLFSAWKKVYDSVNTLSKEVKLLLAGQFQSDSQRLIDLCFELNIYPVVRFLGKVDDIAGLASACDVLVHSSLIEGISNGILEGMACGLPVVATDIPGIRETVGEENLAWLSAPKNADALAEKIIALLHDEKLRKQLGQMNKKRVEEIFSPQKTTAMLYQIIKDNLT